MVLIGAASWHGRGVAVLVKGFDIEGRYGDGANLYGYLGSNPWERSDPSGLEWVEDFRGVAVPMVEIAIGSLPVPLLGGLSDLLGMYHQIFAIAALVGDTVQNSAYMQEEFIDEVLDWSTDDRIFSERTAYGRSARPETTDPFADAADALRLSGPAMGAFNPIRAQSVASERLARRQFKADYVKRCTKKLPKAPANLQSRRQYDGIGTGKNPLLPKDAYMEVKPGLHELNTRVSRQIAFDSDQIWRGGQNILWVLRLKPGQTANPKLTTALKNAGVPYREQFVP